MSKVKIHVHTTTHDADHWITLKKGEASKGTHVKIDGAGNVVAGLGGKKLQLRSKQQSVPTPQPEASPQPAAKPDTQGSAPPTQAAPAPAPAPAPTPAPTPAPETPASAKPAKKPKPKSLPKLSWLDARDPDKRDAYLKQLTKLRDLEGIERSIRKNSFETACIHNPRYGQSFISISQGHSSEVSFNPQQLRMMVGNVLTHNHPNDSSLSGADFFLAAYAQLQEMRAVSSKATYVLRLKNPATDRWPDPGAMKAIWNEEFDFRTKKLRTNSNEGSHEASKKCAAEFGLHYERIPHAAQD